MYRTLASRISFLVALGVFMNGLPATATSESAEIKAYLPYSLPVDVSHITTIADMDISYALASTLVQFDKSGQVSGYLADSWKVTSNHEVIFHLSKAAKWSDGTPITAQQITESMNLAKADRSATLNGLFDSVKSYGSDQDGSFKLSLKPTTSVDEIFKKLTEPCYGTVRVRNGKSDSTVSSGAFILHKSDEKHIWLNRNAYWVNFDDAIAKTVEIRRPPKRIEQDTLSNDSWPNLLTSASLATKEQEKQNSEFNKWYRNSDRVFLIANANLDNVAEGRKLLSRLSHELNRKSLLKDVTGYRESDQIFPAGTVVHVSEISYAPPLPKPSMVSEGRRVRILYSSSRVPDFMLESFKREMAHIFPNGVDFIEHPLELIAREFSSKKYDLYIGSVGVDGANMDGALSYYVEFNMPIISSDSSEVGNFKQRLKQLREQPDSQKVTGYSRILSDAVANYYVLPLFHYSTTAISRKDLDLSSVPATDETVSFSKIKVRRE